MKDWLKDFGVMWALVTVLLLAVQLVAWLVLHFVVLAPLQWPTEVYWTFSRVFIVIAAVPAFLFACEQT